VVNLVDNNVQKRGKTGYQRKRKRLKRQHG
jgi:hypothetical protein